MRRKLDVRSCISLWLVFYLLASRLNISVLAYFLIFFYAPNLLFSSQIINCITCCISFLSVFTHSLYVSHSVFYALTVYPPHSLCIPHHSLYQSLTLYRTLTLCQTLSHSLNLCLILSITLTLTLLYSLSYSFTYSLKLSLTLSLFHSLSHFLSPSPTFSLSRFSRFHHLSPNLGTCFRLPLHEVLFCSFT